MADIKEIKERLAFWQKVEDEGGSPTSAPKLAAAKAELAEAEAAAKPAKKAKKAKKAEPVEEIIEEEIIEEAADEEEQMKSLLLSVVLSCFICGVVPQEWNIHMANYEYADEIKKKKKKKGKKLKGKEKGKKGSWSIFKSKWKKKKEN